MLIVIDEIESNYESHRHNVHEIAKEYFNAVKVTKF